jgi:hypothetical protein
MGYTSNEDGDIKVIDKNGNIKWLSPYIALDVMRMRGLELTLLSAPISLEPSFIEEKQEEINVGIVTKPKRGRKTKQ